MSKKNKEVTEEVEVPEEETIEFEYHQSAFLPVWNETHKRYDMFLLRVNTALESCVVEREALRTDQAVVALRDAVMRLEKEILRKK